MAQICLEDVVKDYMVRDRSDKNFKSIIKPKYIPKRAVDNISFSIEPGEMVGYIGPNGAGKSTTIKILTGILTTSSGKVSVFGNDPCKNRRKNAIRMGVVFGQRSQLLWDLPVKDTFELYKMMYRIDDMTFKHQREMLIDTLDMSGFLDQAVRQLSLGQRMRANLALCFLYKPEIVYLDEPTIGLDVLVKDNLRKFLKQMNKDLGTTILLTTHDTQDIEELSQRLILIDKGKLLFDGKQKEFRNRYQGTEFHIEVEFKDNTDIISNDGFVLVSKEDNRHTYSMEYAHMSHGDAITYIAKRYSVMDIKIRETDLDSIIKNIYKGVN